MFNLMKKYPELLELSGSEQDNWASLSRVFKRDVQDNPDFVFRGDRIYPIKCEGLMDLERLFKHLTHRAEHFTDDAGRDYEKRIYDARRSERLHWIVSRFSPSRSATPRSIATSRRLISMMPASTMSLCSSISVKGAIIC